MKCRISLSTHNQENKWYVYSIYPKHVTRDKRIFLSLKEKDRGSDVTFGNNPPIKIKGKGVVSLDAKIEAQNVL